MFQVTVHPNSANSVAHHVASSPRMPFLSISISSYSILSCTADTFPINVSIQQVLSACSVLNVCQMLDPYMKRYTRAFPKNPPSSLLGSRTPGLVLV